MHFTRAIVGGDMRPSSTTSNQTRPIETMRSASIATSREVARRVRIRAKKDKPDEARGRFAVGVAICASRRARLASAVGRCAARTPSAFRAARAAHAGKPASAFEEEKSRVCGPTTRVRDRHRMAVTACTRRSACRQGLGFNHGSCAAHRGEAPTRFDAQAKGSSAPPRGGLRRCHQTLLWRADDAAERDGRGEAGGGASPADAAARSDVGSDARESER
jgi:hypothetical protein